MRAPLALLTACCLPLLLSGCGEDKTRPLQVPPDRYQQAVSAFTTGVTALVVDDRTRAKAQLEAATKIVPEEPAPWANLALFALRNGDLAAAAEHLEKARILAPPSSPLELLAGLLAGRQGRTDEALAHLRKAVELDPANLRARYALVQELNRQASPESEAEARRQLEQIVAAQPGNLVALLELTRLAAKSGDAAALRQQVDRLASLSASWPPNAKEKLAELKGSLGGANAGAVAAHVAVLGNLIKPTPAYQASHAALQGSNSAATEPLQQFLRLPNPSPAPAAPDTGLSFTAEPLNSTKSAWARALALSPAPPPELNRPPAPDGPITVVQPVGKALSLSLLNGANRSPATLPFPGTTPLPEGVLAIDWNNDYRVDLALAGSGGVRLLEHAASGSWSDVTARAKLPPAVTAGAYTGAWAIDLDLEGDLDIVLGAATGPVLALRNNADGTWSALRPFARLGGALALAWADLDGDADPDVAMIDGGGTLAVFDNERAGSYRRLPGPADLGRVAALSVADANRDGSLDLVVLTSAGSIRRLSRRPGTGDAPQWDTAEIATWQEIPSDGSARLLWADLDNNGATDLVASGTGGGRVWLGNAQVGAPTGGGWDALAAPLDARVLSAVDLDADGRLDLVGVSKAGSPVRLRNQGTKAYHWQVVRARNEANIHDSGSSGNQKINSFGLGGEAELRAGLLVQKQPITGPSLHFGMGEQQTGNYVRIAWPNGQIQGEFDLKADRKLLAKQRLTGSCPWLFAHDGREMRFVTDILWKSPLGLRINAQDTAGVSQTRDWVKVRGDQLRARGGFYDLSITAELWETNFFDYVSLMTVDHPAGAEVLIDERFAIPQPPLELLATAPLQPIAGAHDDRGRDVTDLVRARDGRYLDGFGLGRYQGVTRDHFVEIDLPATDDGATGVSARAITGDGAKRQYPSSRPVAPSPQARSAESPRRQYLVASGWIYPTDSSINVAISQGRHPAPRGLSLQVQDLAGAWRTARAGLGFPAGKNKTVLLDLTGIDGKRIRLRTNLEIYWDSFAIATAVGGPTARPETRLQTREILPQTAELRYRGFSTIHQPARSSPELPEYNELESVSQKWFDLVGFYTRFGDVRELLRQTDDRYVIMNAGDEIVLRFPAPPAPPAGWARDFVFISDGWDKDGNFNTGFSTTVLPLPSHDQPAYDRPPGRLEDDPVYRRHAHDWQRYHTRYVSTRAVRTALWPEGSSWLLAPGSWLGDGGPGARSQEPRADARPGAK
jgi:tetratricopeptide (TPR) repeat protein